MRFMQRKWHQGEKANLFQNFLKPFYTIFEIVFKRKIITILCPESDNTKINLFHYRNTYDYVRVRTLGLIADKINEENIEGDIAECGVFRGDFAERINREFPERKLYLYDTFEGFNQNQKKYDVDLKLISNTHYSSINFTDTNADLVLSKMPFPKQCVIRKGFFPETAKNDSDKIFAFVSIDLDLYQPTFDALCFFYPKLVTGGYIFIHDYGSCNYLGVKEAIKKFEMEFGMIAKVPIPDSSGTIIITKI